MYSLDLASIMGDSTTKCAEESILRIFKEASRNTPSVYIGHILIDGGMQQIIYYKNQFHY